MENVASIRILSMDTDGSLLGFWSRRNIEDHFPMQDIGAIIDTLARLGVESELVFRGWQDETVEVYWWLNMANVLVASEA
jgi:hypothetical protein